jgi:hypothetical protein
MDISFFPYAGFSACTACAPGTYFSATGVTLNPKCISDDLLRSLATDYPGESVVLQIC